MHTYTVPLAGSPVKIHHMSTDADMDSAEHILASTPLIGLDTETSGLDIYSRRSQLRLVQLGTASEAVVVDPTRWGAWLRRMLLDPGHQFVAHNATYDMLVLDHHLGIPLEALAPRTHDTYLLAHLLDPRRKSEGGTGHGLKELATALIDPHADDGKKELYDVFRRELHVSVADGWSIIPAEHPSLVRYAGLDPVLTVRLWDLLAPQVLPVASQSRLYDFERRVQQALAVVERRGLRIDVPYTERLRDELLAESEQATIRAAHFGVDKVNSSAQVGAALIGMGETLTDRTAGGKPRVDQSVLLALADLDKMGDRLGVREPNPLAEAVIAAKRGQKWATAYAQAFLDMRDDHDRIHPSINALSARTGRMSVSRPPLQQLPATDWRIRRAIIADPGEIFVAADYAQVELRILAALAGETTMIDAIQRGEDLHGHTAQLVFGEHYTKAQRRLMKAVGFGKVYGGGAHTLARQTGLRLAPVQEAVSAYDRVYRHIPAYARKLEQEARRANASSGQYAVTTPTGRRLILDRDRTYAATNYVCQSTSRDVTAQAILDIANNGMLDYVRMPIHDEVLASVPADDAEEYAQRLAGIMTRDSFHGVPLAAEGKVIGPSWGTGYGCPPELDWKE